jgi:hypothetical protein
MDAERALEQVKTLLDQERVKEAREIAEFAIAEAQDRRRAIREGWEQNPTRQARR